MLMFCLAFQARGTNNYQLPTSASAAALPHCPGHTDVYTSLNPLRLKVNDVRTNSSSSAAAHSGLTAGSSGQVGCWKHTNTHKASIRSCEQEVG